MKEYKLVIFDMDGTFLDSKTFHTEVFYRFFRQYIGSVSRSAVAKNMGTTVKDIFMNFQIPERDFEDLFHKLERFSVCCVDDILSEIRVGEGIYETLTEIRKRNVRTALVTNSMQPITEQMLKFHGLFPLFDIISGADIDSIDKSVRCEKALEKTQAARDKVILIGDAESDMCLANKMGYDSCFADTEISWYRDKEYIMRVLRPTCTVQHLKEIPSIIFQ